MTQLVNPHWIKFDGEPVTGRTPPRVTVHGPRMSPPQQGAVTHAYQLFCTANLVAVGTYQVRNATFADGTRARMVSNNGVDTVTVWTPESKEKKEEYFGGFLVLPHTDALPLGWGPPANVDNPLGYYSQTPNLSLITPHKKYLYERFVPLKAHPYDWWGDRPYHVSWNHGDPCRYVPRNHAYVYYGAGSYAPGNRPHINGLPDVYILGCRVVTGALRVLGAALYMGKSASGAKQEYIHIVTRKDDATVEFYCAPSPTKDLITSGFFATSTPTWSKIGEYTPPSALEIELEDPWYFSADGLHATTVTRKTTGGRGHTGAWYLSSDEGEPAYYFVSWETGVQATLYTKTVYEITVTLSGDGSSADMSVTGLSATETEDEGGGVFCTATRGTVGSDTTYEWTISGGELIAVDYSPEGRKEVRVSATGLLNGYMSAGAASTYTGILTQTLKLGTKEFSWDTLDASFVSGAGDIVSTELMLIGADARTGVALVREVKSSNGPAFDELGAFAVGGGVGMSDGNEFAYAFYSKRETTYRLLGVVADVKKESTSLTPAISATLYTPAAVATQQLLMPVGSIASPMKINLDTFVDSQYPGTLATLAGKYVMAQVGVTEPIIYLGTTSAAVDIAEKLPPHGELAGIKFNPIKVV